VRREKGAVTPSRFFIDPLSVNSSRRSEKLNEGFKEPFYIDNENEVRYDRTGYKHENRQDHYFSSLTFSSRIHTKYKECQLDKKYINDIK